MAKRGALTHRKTRRLARLLGGIPLPCALGVAESLWHATQAHAPDGAIGQLSDGSIAEEMWWDGDPAQLVEALVESGFVDRHEEHRLVVHGWAEHADAGVHMALARKRAFFASGEIPNFGRLPPHERREAEQFYAGSVVRTESQSVRTEHESVRTPCARQAHAVRESPPRPAPPKEEESNQAAPLLARDGTRAPDDPLPTRHPVQLLSSSLPDPSTWGPEPTTDDPVTWLKQHTIFGDPRYIPEPAALVQTLRASWPEVDLCAAFSAAAKYIATSGPPRNGIRHAIVNEVRFTSERRVRREAAKESQDAAHEKAIQEVFERHRKKRAAAEAGGTTA